MLCLRDGASLSAATRRLYLPVLPWEIAGGLIAAGTVAAYQEIGLVSIAVLAAVLVALRMLRCSSRTPSASATSCASRSPSSRRCTRA